MVKFLVMRSSVGPVIFYFCFLPSRFFGGILGGFFSRIILDHGIVGLRTANHQPWQPGLTDCWRPCIKVVDQWLKRCALVSSIEKHQSLEKIN